MTGRQIDLPSPRRPPRGPDWQRVSHWSFLGALVMLVVLLVPTARCAFGEVKEAEIEDVSDEDSDVWEADKERVGKGISTVDSWIEKVKMCYAANPIGAQDSWKTSLAGGLAGLWLLSWLIHRLTAPRRASLD